MNCKVVRFESTPNPNALKCVLDRHLTDTPRSYFSAGSATEDPLASALFEIEGVTNVLILHEWITVNKRAEAKWPSIKAQIRRVVGERA